MTRISQQCRDGHPPAGQEAAVLRETTSASGMSEQAFKDASKPMKSSRSSSPRPNARTPRARRAMQQVEIKDLRKGGAYGEKGGETKGRHGRCGRGQNWRAADAPKESA